MGANEVRVFILEGILTVLIACSAPFLLPDDPATCSFLTEEERATVAHRLTYDTETSHGSFDAQEAFKWKYVWTALLDHKVWAVVVVYCGSAIPIYGKAISSIWSYRTPLKKTVRFIYTLPTVLKELGYTAEIAVSRNFIFCTYSTDLIS